MEARKNSWSPSNAKGGIAGGVHPEGIQDGRLLGLLDEAGDALVRRQFA